MSLLGCEWESIERHEKLRAAVFARSAVPRREKRKFAAPSSRPAGRDDWPERLVGRRARNYVFWPQLTKDNVQRKLFKFQGR